MPNISILVRILQIFSPHLPPDPSINNIVTTFSQEIKFEYLFDVSRWDHILAFDSDNSKAKVLNCWWDGLWSN